MMVAPITAKISLSRYFRGHVVVIYSNNNTLVIVFIYIKLNVIYLQPYFYDKINIQNGIPLGYNNRLGNNNILLPIIFLLI